MVATVITNGESSRKKKEDYSTLVLEMSKVWIWANIK